MSQPLLSVVVPITKMADKLGNLKQSLEIAAFREIEVILVHDVADQDTSQQLARLTEEIPKLNFVFKEDEFGNPGEARNAGLKLVSGRWVAFWDSDDLPFVEEFTLMVENADKQGASLAIGGIETSFFGSQVRKGIFPAFPVNSRDSVFQLAQMPAFTRMAFRSIDLNTAEFPALSMGEDLVFLARSRFLEKRIYIHPKSVYLYILNFPGQLTRDLTKLKQLSEIWDYLYEESKQTIGDMHIYITFQMFRNLIATLKSTQKFHVHSIKWGFLCFIKNPKLTIAIIMKIVRNQDILERKNQN